MERRAPLSDTSCIVQGRRQVPSIAIIVAGKPRSNVTRLSLRCSMPSAWAAVNDGVGYFFDTRESGVRSCRSFLAYRSHQPVPQTEGREEERQRRASEERRGRARRRTARCDLALIRHSRTGQKAVAAQAAMKPVRSRISTPKVPFPICTA
jgi:hypothetical protein